MKNLTGFFLDIGIKTMDGITVLEVVKKDTQISHIPVIMVSGDNSKETIKKCTRLNCVWYLAKPVNADELGNDQLDFTDFEKAAKENKRFRKVF